MKKVSDLMPATHRVSNAELKMLRRKAYLNDTDECPMCGVLMFVSLISLEWIHPITDCKVKRVYYNATTYSSGRAL